MFRLLKFKAVRSTTQVIASKGRTALIPTVTKFSRMMISNDTGVDVPFISCQTQCAVEYEEGNRQVPIQEQWVDEIITQLQDDKLSSISRIELTAELRGRILGILENSRKQYNEVQIAIDSLTRMKLMQNTLGYLKWLCWVRIIIDRFETDYGVVNIKIDWNEINQISNKLEKSKSIRRQRWVKMLTKTNPYPAIQDLITLLSDNDITVEQFARDMSDGYDLISDSIKSVILLPDAGPIVGYGTTEKRYVNRSIELLLKEFDFNVGQPKKL